MRKILALFAFIFTIMLGTAVVSAESTVDKTSIDTSTISSGVIKAGFISEQDKKCKIRIEKDSHTYFYNINNDGAVESYPLQMGNGTYRVSILENIVDNRYRVVYTQSVEVTLNSENSVYLDSVQNINWNEETAAVKLAKKLTAGIKEDKDKIAAIYNYLVTNVRYDYDKLKTLQNDYNPDVDTVINSGKGICYDYASTFAAMLRSVGIPAKLIKGYTTNVEGYHAWNEVYNKDTGKWMVVDTTYDAAMKAGKAKYTMEKDGSIYNKVNEY